MPPGHLQRSLDDLGTALHDVRFCVLDLETTGGDPGSCSITEVGAVSFRGGECLGTFQTLVDPGRAIPPTITVLTGITQAMVTRAPRIETVLPSLLEFIGDAVVVGHNVRFDLNFLNAALARDQRPPLTNRWVDTCAVARRLVADEVPNCKLGTLADRLRLDHRPSHRALDDALATADLLHLLLERAGRLGVTGLDDLLDLPTMGNHPQAAKLRLTDGLPRTPGVYLFRDRRGEVLYVGKATNLRARVRSYFSSDTRRKVGSLLRETAAIDHEPSPHPLHAAVHELRLLHRLDPRYNRQGTTWRRHVWLKLTLGEPFPRLSVVRVRRDDGARYLGPLPSQRMARRAAEAIEAVVPLRRCTARPAGAVRPAPCAPAQLGVSSCPCAGAIDESSYGRLVALALRGLEREPALLLEPLAARMSHLADLERFEEAADVRDRAAALAQALRRQRRLDQLERSGELVVEVRGGGGAVLDGGRLASAWGADGAAPLALALPAPRLLPAGWTEPPAGSREATLWAAEERLLIAAWLDAEATTVRLRSCTETLTSPAARLLRFEPGRRRSPTPRPLRRTTPLHSV